MSLACALLGLLSLSSPAAPPPSAAGEDPASRSASVIARSFGAFDADGGIGAAGPGYAARFVGGGVEFTPALGDAAPRSYPVFFALESIRREGAMILDNLPPVSPTREGNFVRYTRGEGIVESYEARVDGVEQSFHFASRPAGEGDLIVRGRVTTDLSVASQEEESEEIRFQVPGLGGVTWGTVTGIDSNGSRMKGNLRVDGTHLELALPGEFVDRAVFPLLLDPLIGPVIFVNAGPTSDYKPDVAYDVTNDVYLVVWYRRYSATNRAVFGQRFLSTGAFVGPLIAITATNGNFHSPAVANVNVTDRFLVAYTSGSSGFSTLIIARAVDAFDGLVSSSVTVWTASFVGANADVGGHRGGSPTALVVTANSATGAIVVSRVTVPAIGVPTLGTFLVASGANSDPSFGITKHGGTYGRFLVTWKRLTGNGNHDVHARLIDLNLIPLTGETTVSADLIADETVPDCATQDGTHFAVVYERRDSGPSGNSDIACRSLTYNAASGSLAVSSETILAGGSSLDQVQPAIDFAASKYLVAWASFAVIGGGWSVRMMGIDPNGCVPCEPVTILDSSSSGFVWAPEIGAQYSGSSFAGDEALVVWESSVDVKAQRVEAIGAGGAVTSLGGGCGGGGMAGVNGPVALGSANFAFTLSGAAGPAATLVLGTSRLNLACGTCTLVPALDFLLPGSSPLALPIPCNLSLLGGTLYAQWIVLAPGGCPLAPALSVSGAVSAGIGL